MIPSYRFKSFRLESLSGVSIPANNSQAKPPLASYAIGLEQDYDYFLPIEHPVYPALDVIYEEISDDEFDEDDITPAVQAYTDYGIPGSIPEYAQAFRSNTVCQSPSDVEDWAHVEQEAVSYQVFALTNLLVFIIHVFILVEG